MTSCQSFFFPSQDKKTTLHAMIWKGDQPPRAVLQISHGICEYIARYDHFARYLSEQGFIVVGHDHLGHGQSWQAAEREGFFAEENGWNLVVDDIESLRQQTARQYPGLPYFLLGHSMGSFLARTHLIRYPGRFTGVIICGTGQQPPRLVQLGWKVTDRISKFRSPFYRSKRVIDMTFGTYNRAFRPNRTNFDWVCGSEAVVDAYIQDRSCQFLPTVGLYRDMMEGIQFISDRENLKKMDRTTPIFFISGALDPVGEAGKGVDRAYQSFLFAGCANVSKKLYPSGRHELLNEDFRETVYTDVLQWMEKQMPHQ